MRALRFVLVFILIVILFFIALAPWENGYLFRKKYQNFIKIINKQQSVYHLDIQSYHVGWFSSDVKLYLSIYNSQSAGNGFSIKQHIIHGPYVYLPNEGFKHLYIVIKTHARMDDALAALAKLQTPLVFNLTTRIGLKNNTTTQYEVDPLIFSSANTKLSFQKIDGLIKFKPKMPIQYTIHGKGISLLADDTQIDVSDFSFDYNEHCDLTGCKIIKNLTIPNTVLANKQVNYGLSGIRLAYTSIADTKHIANYTINLIAEKITNPQNQWGPFSMNLTMNNVNDLAFKNVSISPQANNNNPVMPTFVYQFINHLPELMTNNTVISDTAYLTVHGGNITFDGKLLWPSNVPLPQEVKSITQQLHLDAKLHIDSAVIDQSSAAFITQWKTIVKEGYFIQDASGYTMTLTNDNGIIIINQKILDLIKPIQTLKAM